jgi:septum site-determining protein MinD
MVKKGDMLGVSDVLDILQIGLIGMVPDDENVVKSANEGRPLTLGDGAQAAAAFKNIAARITGKDIPFMNLEVPKKGFFARIKDAFGGGR